MRASGRLEPCRLLQQNKIACSVWFEDAIAHYGVPTVLFDLYIMVLDIDAAAKLLRQNGWSQAPPRDEDMFNFLGESTNTLRYSRLSPPGMDQELGARTVLLPAHDWNLTVDQLCQSMNNKFYPLLSTLLDSLIGNLLDSTEGGLQCHLGVQLSYVYAHVPQVNHKAFLEQLSLQYRQFHLDCLAGMDIATLPFLAHERRIRADILAGKHQFQKCSVSMTIENSALFGV